MKYIALFSALFIFIMSFMQPDLQAQNQADTTKTYLILKNDGSQYIGKILSQDARDVQIVTREMGELIIPKHEIKEISEIEEDELTKDGKLKPSDAFSTRYFINTNGLPLRKGDSYIIWTLYGPDVQFGVRDYFSLGLMTSWFGVPIIGSAKYSIPLSDNTNLALGTLLGTGSWAEPQFGLALPYGALTLGDGTKNLTLSTGYGAVWTEGESAGRILFSLAGMTALNDKFSLIFDSFIISGTGNDDGAALLIPGIRLQTDPTKAFQLGFAAVAADGDLVPFPLPMLQWFRQF